MPREWPCLMRADAPPSPPETPRPLISGAKGEVDVYQETATLERPTDPRYFQWGAPPSGGGSGGARSVARAGAAAAAGTGGGDAEAARARANRPSPRAKRAGGARRAEEDAAASAWASRVREVSVEAPGVQAFRVQREK